MNEIDLAHVAQKLAILGIASGFIGAALWQLVMGLLGVLAEHLHQRAQRLHRIRSRASHA